MLRCSKYPISSLIKRRVFISSQSCRFLSSSSSSGSNLINDDQKLRSDVKMLGQTLGSFIKATDESVYESVEKLRLLGRKWRQSDSNKNEFEEMVEEVKTFDANKLIGVARAFTHFLGLANTAENHHRQRRLKERLLNSGTDSAFLLKSDSVAGTISKLKNEMKISNEAIFDAISSQCLEIVLTAHPTEVNRRTMIRKNQRIDDILDHLDRDDILPYDKRQLLKELKAIVSSIWESDELRRTKPGPIKEARTGLAVLENVLWNAVPAFLRKLDDEMTQQIGKSLPLNASPVKIASWMGGDRDGNPNVTPIITYEVAMLSRWLAATLYKEDITKLRSDLSLRPANKELLELTNNSREPYRDILRELELRLDATIDFTNDQLKSLNSSANLSLTDILKISSLSVGKNNHLYDLNNLQPISKSSELLEPLMLLHRSLVETNNHEMASGFLTDVIRKVTTFQLALVPMDIRQESTRHSEALDAITRYLGVGSYLQWDEATRRNWLSNELASKRPLLPTHDLANPKFKVLYKFNDTVIDTLNTFQVAAELSDAGSLGAYVISQCQQASDILAVTLLQQEYNVNPLLRVVPLFETLDDLERSANTIDALFSISNYRNLINNRQEIMVGYSDSAKDAGRLAASWEQYNAQEAMIKVANRYGVEVTFFHGKGGTVGRGGNPAIFHAILAHPPNTINGRFRVTEQGEMITQNFGQDMIAQRTLDLFTSGILMERFLVRPEPKKEWRDMMKKLAIISCDAYRGVVRGEKRFVPYFRSATPELELSKLNVGSRPSKRNPKGGVESLRAIPWVFAWTQTRLNLPTWLGVGEALSNQLSQPDSEAVLKDMYSNWPWFRTLIDLLEMILVKSEEKIAENYDKQLVSDKESLELGVELRNKLTETTRSVLQVSGNISLQQHNKILIRSLNVRNPYVDPLNVIQAELLKRLRQYEQAGTVASEDEELLVLQDALLITINGIANGMRNSG